MSIADALSSDAPPVYRVRGADPRLLSVVLVHERYQQPGGEDRVVADEAELLRSRGHRVVTVTADNRDVGEMSPAALAKATLWNGEAYRRLRAVLRAERPSVVHFHNTFPLLSPAVYRAARREGALVAQTLHNYRLLCPNALLFHDGSPCEACVGRAFPWPAVAHACYRDSRLATAAVGTMVAVHRALGTWARDVDAYVALSELARKKFVAGGLPKAKLFVRPNYLADDPGAGAHGGGFALFVGRLSAEKGIGTLMRGWASLGGSFPLKVVGDGPLEGEVAGVAGVEWLGVRSRDEVLRLMREAALLVFPSECYENFPVTLVEAFATGLPVLAASGGVAGDVVRAQAAGLAFRAGDPADLAATAARMLLNHEWRRGVERAARAAYERDYTAERAYERLMAVYGAAGAALSGFASSMPSRLK
jgi:glycosyltransferase involved in cell wall biosynthesis